MGTYHWRHRLRLSMFVIVDLVEGAICVDLRGEVYYQNQHYWADRRIDRTSTPSDLWEVLARNLENGSVLAEMMISERSREQS
jgi:hypothetical protein